MTKNELAFCNNYVEGSFPELFYEKDRDVAFEMITKIFTGELR